MLFQGKKITCIITYNDKKYSFDLDRHKTVNDLYNIFTEKCPDKNYPFIIMVNSNKNLIEINNLDTTLLSLERDEKDQIMFQFIKSFKCQSCLSNCDNENRFINKYCLDCNQFICSNCSKKIDSKHNVHYLINIDQNNLKDSIKLWNINLNADLSNQITFFNRQFNFINEKDSEIKKSFWLDNIFKKLKYYESILNEISNKYQELKSILKETEEILNKAMSNLTKSEQEINSDIYSNEKIANKFFSFSEAEMEIQKLKNNYIEIKEVKSKISTIIDINNIKKYEEILYNIPRAFDDLSKAAFLILEDLKIYEQKNKKSIKKESKDKNRKITEIFLNNKSSFKTASDTANSMSKNKNIYKFYENDRKRTDFSVKLKDIVTFSENNEEINYIFRDSNKQLNIINNSPLIDNRRKISEIKLFKNRNKANEGESSRYTPKNLKLPKIIINNDKEKKNINILSHYSDDIKKSAEFHKSSILSKKLINKK